MAKKAMKAMGGTCPTEGKCPCWFSWAVLGVGILYLLSDLFPMTMFGWFGATFSWWTVAFVLMGLKCVCKQMCK